MLKITFESSGADKFVAMLGAHIDAAMDFRPAWDEVEKEIESFEKKLFATGGSADGLTKWAPRKTKKGNEHFRTAMTALTGKKYKSGNRPLLIDTGKLVASLTNSGADGAVRAKEPLFMIFGTAVQNDQGVMYAGFHQHGTRFMPARPPLRTSENLMRKIMKILQVHVIAQGGRKQRIKL